MRKAKIVCTMGPATAGVPKLIELIEAGMDVARLNLSHGDHAFHRKTYHDLRAAAQQAGKPVAILADLCGPKIRVGNMMGGQIQLKKGESITLVPDEIEGTPQKISHSYHPLARDTRLGEHILLDDGMLELEIQSIRGEEVTCKILNSGPLKNHKGMNLPQSKLSIPALTEKDKADIIFGRELGVDFFALSFVRSPEDVKMTKTLAGDIPVIAKIEKPEAVACLDAILDIADGVMVARGDLGVEAGQEKVPLIQKKIIHEAQRKAKPVITATQMLESMIQNPRPTRAEVSDVANAILDGTDAVMLSAETSVGAYPIEAVKTIGSIMDELQSSPDMKRRRIVPCRLMNRQHGSSEKTFTNAIADASVAAARDMDLKAIAVYTESGHSAALVSSHRPYANIIAFSRHPKILNRLSLYWGVRPLFGEWVSGVPGVVAQAERELLKYNMVIPGDEIAITFGMVIGGESFQTNIMKLWKVRPSV